MMDPLTTTVTASVVPLAIPRDILASGTAVPSQATIAAAATPRSSHRHDRTLGASLTGRP